MIAVNMKTRIAQELWKLHVRLAKAGVDICERPTVLATEAFFPFRYTPDARGAEAITQVLCNVCGVPGIQLRVLPVADDVETVIANASVRYAQEGPVANSSLDVQSGRQATIRVKQALLGNAKLLSAELLRHVVLLALKQKYRVPLGKPNRTWLLVDLAAVYLGCGVLAANAAFEFTRGRSGWTAKSSGVVTEEQFGYALALYAFMRGEQSPGWSRHLDPNVRASFRSQSKALAAQGDPRFAICRTEQHVSE